MAKISSYPSDANVTVSDRLIGTDNENSNETKNFQIGDIIDLAEAVITPNLINTYVPYTGANQNVNLGPNTLTVQNAVVVGDLNVTGGLRVDGNAGAAGSVLMSAGSGVTPIWYDLTSLFVPYTGATGSVNLGSFSLLATNVETSFVFPTTGNNSIYVGDANISNPSGLFLDLAANSYYLGDYDGVYNGTSIVIQDTSERISFQGGFSVSNGQGTSGQVLVSQGSGVTPKWEDTSSVVYMPCLSAHSQVQQTALLPNVAYPMRFENIDFQDGISIVSNGTHLTRITPASSGIYNVQFSAQIERTTGGSPEVIDIWLRYGGVNVPASNTSLNVQSNSGFLVAAWNFFIPVDITDANPYVEIMWATTSTAITLQQKPSNAIHPSTPSIILTVNKVSINNA